VAVPSTLVEIRPEWRGYSYFVANEEIVIVKPDRRIVAVFRAAAAEVLEPAPKAAPPEYAQKAAASPSTRRRFVKSSKC
jgi:hypothetical protein